MADAQFDPVFAVLDSLFLVCFSLLFFKEQLSSKDQFQFPIQFLCLFDSIGTSSFFCFFFGLILAPLVL